MPWTRTIPTGTTWPPRTARWRCPCSGPTHQPPVWPQTAEAQQMQAHLEVRVDGDLLTALDRAIALGATLAAYQPQDDVRVLLDPAGHPFCLWVPN